MNLWRGLTVFTAVVALLAACAPPPPRSGSSAGAAAISQAPKRVTIAITGQAPALSNKLNRNNSIQGVDKLQLLVNAGATDLDQNNERRPQLAEAVPSVENGLWKVLPDGTMETVYRLRNGLTWHDGTPLTADDLVFTMQVGRDPDFPLFSSAQYASLGTVEVVDARSVVAKWTRPFIDADTLFSATTGLPLPRHILGPTYQNEKEKFEQVPYWTTEFVGTGPFKLREFVRDSHVSLEAFNGYVHGRPKIDLLDVRFLTDGNVMMANILSGAVEMYLGRGLSIEQGMQVRDQWTGGRLEPIGTNAINLWPQLLTPNPQIITDLQFRRALKHAIDMPEMTGILTAGLGNALESFVRPNDPEFNDVQSAIVRYPYDPRRSMEILTGLGYTRAADGIFRGPTGETISVEIRTLSADLNQKTTLSVVDYWRRVGVDASIFTIPPQRQGEAEFRANFPGFQILLGSISPIALHTSRAPLASNNFQVTGNYPRYMNPEYDALADRYYATIPRAERMEVLRQVIRWQTDQLLAVPLFQYVDPSLISNRLKNVVPNNTFNIHEWEAVY